jgi:hypothetical protein
MQGVPGSNPGASTKISLIPGTIALGQPIAFADPDAVVQTDWLAARLADPGLRIFACTPPLRPAQAGTNAPYQITSGRQEYAAAHIPNIIAPAL